MGDEGAPRGQDKAVVLLELAEVQFPRLSGGMSVPKLPPPSFHFLVSVLHRLF